MPMKVVLEINHPNGKPDITRPAFICDACGEEITKERRGHYLWNPRTHEYESGEPVDFYLAHVPECREVVAEMIGSDEYRVADIPLE
jgi:hypothetical protein